MRNAYGKQNIRKSKSIRRVCAVLSVGAALLAGCGKDGGEPVQEELAENQAAQRESVELTVWGAEEDTQLMGQLIESFQKEYEEQADFQITYEVQSESGCKDALFGGLEEGADVFAFADDQLNALAAAGAVDPVEAADTIRAEHLETAVEAASVGNTMYAYPLTADNGYFLYYNKEFFSEEDVSSLERMLEIAADNGKYLAMDWSSAWYVYAFFGNTGMEVGLNEDGITNFCTWNRKDGGIKGTDVAQSMLELAKSPGFSNRTDTEFLEGVLDGSVIAGVSGVWNAVALQDAWKEQMGAAKLPSFACAGQQVQMASFSGCKLIGVNAYSSYPKWAAKLAEWIISEQNQNLRFEMRGQGPSNKRAAASAQVQDSPAIAALLAQAEFSQLQRVGGKFWEPVETFAGNMAQGNASGEDLQKQLDRMVEKVTER
ncbi:MAG: extracellular solute-binding protein [Eubacterium sp.]|nr:extracellular solute-binding protein [Eubacterium sp.]